ncbi:unnamed protein product [marine sediment metagenome]|uniref:Uncharacterized protein n=1 Tax=marine sediment metagenome TaxID=412755 RepID=X1AMU1_9ZZZZ
MGSLDKLATLIIVDSRLEFISIEIFDNMWLNWIDLRGNNLKNIELISKQIKKKIYTYFEI